MKIGIFFILLFQFANCSNIKNSQTSIHKSFQQPFYLINFKVNLNILLDLTRSTQTETRYDAVQSLCEYKEERAVSRTLEIAVGADFIPRGAAISCIRANPVRFKKPIDSLIHNSNNFHRILKFLHKIYYSDELKPSELEKCPDTIFSRPHKDITDNLESFTALLNNCRIDSAKYHSFITKVEAGFNSIPAHLKNKFLLLYLIDKPEIHFEKMFEKYSGPPDIEVLNTGIIYYKNKQYPEKFRKLIEQSTTDMLVTVNFDGHNIFSTSHFPFWFSIIQKHNSIFLTEKILQKFKYLIGENQFRHEWALKLTSFSKDFFRKYKDPETLKKLTADMHQARTNHVDYYRIYALNEFVDFLVKFQIPRNLYLPMLIPFFTEEDFREKLEQTLFPPGKAETYYNEIISLMDKCQYSEELLSALAKDIRTKRYLLSLNSFSNSIHRSNILSLAPMVFRVLKDKNKKLITGRGDGKVFSDTLIKTVLSHILRENIVCNWCIVTSCNQLSGKTVFNLLSKHLPEIKTPSFFGSVIDAEGLSRSLQNV